MKNIPAPTPTTSTHTLPSGESLRITEWTVGAYTLRKFVEPHYTGWTVLTADPNLPRIRSISPGPAPVFAVSVPSCGELFRLEALTLAEQITEAAHIAATFNKIAAAN